jgi:hypothetical protein
MDININYIRFSVSRRNSVYQTILQSPCYGPILSLPYPTKHTDQMDLISNRQEIRLILSDRPGGDQKAKSGRVPIPALVSGLNLSDQIKFSVQDERMIYVGQEYYKSIECRFAQKQGL